MKLDFNWHGKTRHKNAHGTKKAFDEDRNADFNRYSDVVLWDATRVRLRRGPGGNDYIHASHVKGGDFPMICAQGPVEESVERFWIMIVEQNCQIVVQLCQNEEDGKEKCFRYLPAAEHEKFGAVSVKVKEMTKTMPSNQEVKRTILEASFAGRTIEVVHLLYDGWPDHDVPLNPNYFRHLRTYVHKLATAKKCTVVIHCSAGIGRTGTYAAIEMAVRNMVKNDTEVQMSNIVPVLRDQRASAVQTDLQYVFIHRAVIDAAKEAQKLTTAADKDKIASFVTEYEQLVVRKRKERLDILNAKK